MPDSSKLMMSHGQSKRHHVTVDLLTEEQPDGYHFLPEAQSSSAQTANRGLVWKDFITSDSLDRINPTRNLDTHEIPPIMSWLGVAPFKKFPAPFRTSTPPTIDGRPVVGANSKPAPSMLTTCH